MMLDRVERRARCRLHKQLAREGLRTKRRGFVMYPVFREWLRDGKAQIVGKSLIIDLTYDPLPVNGVFDANDVHFPEVTGSFEGFVRL